MKLVAYSYEVNLTEEDFLDIVDTAGYSIGYWAVSGSVDKNNCTYTVQYFDQENDRAKATVSKDNLESAIAKILNSEVECSDSIVGYIEDDDIDGEAADVIIQIAIFGSIVYC